MVSSKKKSTVMSPIRRRMKKCNPSSGHNSQLVHWWLLIHFDPFVASCHYRSINTNHPTYNFSSFYYTSSPCWIFFVCWSPSSSCINISPSNCWWYGYYIAMISTSSSSMYWGLSSFPLVIISSLTTFCIFPFSISSYVGAFCIFSFPINCVSTSSTMDIKGFAIFSPDLSTPFTLISLKILEASATSPGFPSWAGDSFAISLLMVITNLLFFFFFFYTSKIALTSTIIFSFLLWVFFLVPMTFLSLAPTASRSNDQ